MAGKPRIRDVERWRATQVCTCFNLRRASRAVTRLHDHLLRSSGLRATQFSILLALSALGSVPLGRLADGMVIDRTTLSRNIKPLISKGYIQTHGGRDRRSRLLGLSAAGEIKVRNTMGLWQIAQDHIIAGGGDRAGIGEPLWARMREDLDAIVAAALAPD